MQMFGRKVKPIWRQKNMIIILAAVGLYTCSECAHRAALLLFVAAAHAEPSMPRSALR